MTVWTGQEPRKRRFVKPTRHRSTILGMLHAVWIELVVMFVGWMILRWVGWV